MIGGEYYLSLPEAVTDSLAAELSGLFSEISYFSTGRDALYSLLASIDFRRVWLPDFLCNSVWAAARQVGKPVGFYPVGENLCAAHEWMSRVEANDVVLLIHFFGMADLELLARLRQLDVTVVSDVSHLLFNSAGLSAVAEASDFSLASLRKSAPFPDGAFCGSNMHSVPAANEATRREFWTLRAAALSSRCYSARQGFADDENFFLFRQAEAILDDSPAGRHAMSFLAGGILNGSRLSIERGTLAENAEVLAAGLGRVCEVPAHGRGISQYFPCVFHERRQRDDVREALSSERIHCPVHWDTTFLPDPHPLSDRILSIPCDARYAVRDMERIVREVVAAL